MIGTKHKIGNCNIIEMQTENKITYFISGNASSKYLRDIVKFYDDTINKEMFVTWYDRNIKPRLHHIFDVKVIEQEQCVDKINSMHDLILAIFMVEYANREIDRRQEAM